MNRRTAIILIILAPIILAAIIISLRRGVVQEERKLLLHSGGGLRLAVNECVETFSKEHNVEIECNYAGSDVLLSQVQMTRKGDLFMPGDVFYVDKVQPADLIVSKHTVCYFIPQILVRKGNPKNIQTLEDLLKPGIKLGLGDPEVCAVGRTSVLIFEKNGMNMEDIKKNLVFSSLTVEELGVQIKVGKVDAVIVWDATAAHYADSGDAIRIPVDRNIISTVAIALLSTSRNKKLAGEFIDFITSQRGKAIFQKHNFSTEVSQ